MKYGYLYGNKGRRKMRSPWYDSAFARNLAMNADKLNGFKVRPVQKSDKTKTASKKVI